MPRDRKLDPVTGDYVADAAGGWEYVETIESEAMHALKDRRRTWEGAPDDGSELHLLQQANLGERDRLLAKRYAEEALQRLVDAGRASRVRATSTIDTTYDRIELRIEIDDVANGGIPVDFVTPIS